MKRSNVLGELVKLESSSGQIMDGILYSRGNESLVLHVHGSLGNFYQNEFVPRMAHVYLDAGLDMLSFNLSARDGVGEGYWLDGAFQYVGGSIVAFDSCLDDIAGAIHSVQDSWKRLVLQGHSLGCDRILHFVVTGGVEFEVVLLAPCDSYALQRNWLKGESVEEQIERLRRSEGRDVDFDWLPITEYGIRQGQEVYSVPVTRRTLLGILAGAPFRYLRLDRPVDFFANCRTFAYFGGADPLRTTFAERFKEHLNGRVRSLTSVVLKDGDHMLSSCAERVAQRIVEWLRGEGTV